MAADLAPPEDSTRLEDLGGPARADHAKDLSRVRRYTRWSMIGMVGLTVALPLIDLAQRDVSATAVVAIVAALLLVGYEQLRLVLGAIDRLDARAWREPRAIGAGVVSLLLLVLLASGPERTSPGWWALPFAGMLAGAVLLVPAPRRWWVAVAGALVAGATATLAAVIGDSDVLAASVVVVPVLFVAGSAVLQVWLWDVTVRLDEARASAGELAVLRERLRFAADLHDVQGHHLQAIALKAELTRRLIGRDDEAARRNATEIHELTLEALSETRALVHGYRRVGLVTELENAVAILRAAGVETSVAGTPERVPESLQSLFGSLVREGATNLLRHTQAERCTLSVEVEGADVVLRVEDDGTARSTSATDDDPGTGIVALRERFAAVGGRVEAAALPERGFALTGRAPR